MIQFPAVCGVLSDGRPAPSSAASKTAVGMIDRASLAPINPHIRQLGATESFGLMCLMEVEMLSNITCTWPPRRSVSQQAFLLEFFEKVNLEGTGPRQHHHAAGSRSARAR